MVADWVTGGRRPTIEDMLKLSQRLRDWFHKSRATLHDMSPTTPEYTCSPPPPLQFSLLKQLYSSFQGR